MPKKKKQNRPRQSTGSSANAVFNAVRSPLPAAVWSAVAPNSCAAPIRNQPASKKKKKKPPTTNLGVKVIIGS